MATRQPANPAPQRTLFDSCPATRELVVRYGGCPLCPAPADAHGLEADIAGTVPEDAPFEEWIVNLPRSPADNVN